MSENKWNIFDNFCKGIILIKKNEKIVYYNNQFLKDFRISVKDVETKTFSGVFQDSCSEIKEIKKSFKYKSSIFKDLRVLLKNGEKRIFNIDISKTMQDGESYMILLFEDISEHKASIQKVRNSEKKLKISEEKYKTLTENLKLGVFRSSTGIEGKFLEVNQAMVEIFGFVNKEELLSISPEKLYKLPKDRGKFIRELTKSGFYRAEEVFKKKDGSYFDANTQAVAVKDNSGEIIYFDGIIEDITERKKEDKRKRKLDTRIRQAQKFESLNVMAGSIAHNFNNLLMVVIGSIEMILLKYSFDSLLKTELERAEKASRRAAELSNMMLTYVGKKRMSFERINLADLITDMFGIMEVSISKKAVLRFLPQQEQVNFKGDAVQIRQIIMNILRNAAESIGDGEKRGVITLRTGKMYCSKNFFKQPYDKDLKEGEYIFLEIIDNGSGMNNEVLSKAFDPFFTTKFTGRGLGLAAVLGIIRAHKGSVSILSQEGKGTLVRIFIPSISEKSDSKELEEYFEDKTEKLWKYGETVMVVDDEEMILDVAGSLLRKFGFNVIVAQDGKTAIELFKKNKNKIRFVLLDIIMPGLDGQEVLVEFRKINPDVPVILSSGYSEEEMFSQYTSIKKEKFIHKPYRMIELKNKIKEVLQ
jgi:PAS domain S-box-containing protein